MSESFKLVNLTKDEVMLMPAHESSLLTWVLSGASDSHADAANRLIVSLKKYAPWYGSRLVLAGEHTPAWQAARNYKKVSYTSLPPTRTNPQYVVNATKGEYVDNTKLRWGSDPSLKLRINPLPVLLVSGSFDGSRDKLPGNMKDVAGTWSGDSIASYNERDFLSFQKKYNEKIFNDLLKVCDDKEKVASVAEKMYLREIKFQDESLDQIAAQATPPSPVPATTFKGYNLNVINGAVRLASYTTFVITGKLDRVRSDYETMIHRAGHSLANKINHTVDYLVVGERPGSVKLKDAEKHGTKVITLSQLRTALGNP